MRVLLVDVDSKIPNLALMKLSTWYQLQGDIVGLDVQNPDKVVVSVVFSKNKGQANGIREMFPDALFEIGGSGWSLGSTLPKEIDTLKPDYDLYPSKYSQGFTTRGCIRKCKFCIVPQKEGMIRIDQHPSKFHDDRFKTCMIMDNNLLAIPEWFEDVAVWFNETGTKMLSHGWDTRLLNEHSAGLLKDIKHEKGLQFSWDNINDEKYVIQAVKYLKDAGFNLKNQISFYVLAGFNSTFEEDLYRCNKLRELGVNAFVMPYHKKDKRINRLAKWANRRWAYWSTPFEVKK